MMEEEIKMLNEVGMLERIHSLTRKCISCVCSFSKTGRLFTKVIRNVLVRQALSSLRSTLVAPLCKQGMMVRDTVTELSPLKIMVS